MSNMTNACSTVSDFFGKNKLGLKDEDHSNPLKTRYSFINSLLSVISTYTKIKRSKFLMKSILRIILTFLRTNINHDPEMNNI